MVERCERKTVHQIDKYSQTMVGSASAVGVEFDGLERVSTQTLLDLLEVPQRSRTAGTYRRLAKLMAELGWTAVRVRDLNRRGFKEQVRGYFRNGRVQTNLN